MESLLNLISQSAPVLASLLTGIWFLSNKFNIVEKKCDLIAQKVDFLGSKVDELENSTENITSNIQKNSERFSSDVNKLDRRILKIEITNDNENEKSA